MKLNLKFVRENFELEKERSKNFLKLLNKTQSTVGLKTENKRRQILSKVQTHFRTVEDTVGVGAATISDNLGESLSTPSKKSSVKAAARE
jgi:hypothetical protein